MDDNLEEFDGNFLDLKNYEKNKLISKGNSSKVYEVRNKITNAVFSAKISMITVNDLSRDEMIHLSREVNIISRINHPSFLKFIGYSPINFNKQYKPVIVTELCRESLFHVLNSERKNNSILKDTNKLIIIYGIAAGMSYLHSHDIIHRNLNPKSIFLVQNLHPKIGNFALTTKIHTLRTLTFQSTAGIKGNSIYSSPELLKSGHYSKSSDVYAFALIVYELMTLKIPFEDIPNYNELFERVVNLSKRPKVDNSIPDSYKKLIESCWSQNPEDRPTFESIENFLRTDIQFITEKVNEEDFEKYVLKIENSEIDFSSEKNIMQIDHLIKEKNKVVETFSDEVVDQLSKKEYVAVIEKKIINYLLAKRIKIESNEIFKIYKIRIGNSRFDNDFISIHEFNRKFFNNKSDIKQKFQKLCSEYKSLNEINHPNIIKALGFYQGDSRNPPSILFEYYSKSLIKIITSLDEIFLVSIIYEICHAMINVHSNHIIHGNLNPKTILIDNEKHVKISSFGISIFLNHADQIKSEIENIFCLAPQLFNDDGYDEKVDVFAFGIIMQFILTRGKGPFLSPEDISSGKKIRVPKTVNRLSFSIISRFLFYSPDERPSFISLAKTIKKNNFMLIDGIESKIPMLKNYLKLIVK